MATRRCIDCGINYPVTDEFRLCPLHETATKYYANASCDEDWEAQMARLKAWLGEEAEIKRPIPLVRDVEAYEENGQLFVDQIDLHQSKLRLWNGPGKHEEFYLFELEDGWIYETQGWDDRLRRWWVAKVMLAVLVVATGSDVGFEGGYEFGPAAPTPGEQ